MPSSESVLKRSSSSISNLPDEPLAKRAKRPYHHHHRLQKPLTPALREPAVTDDSLDQWMGRAIATSLKETGFDLAQPVALECVRQAAEECMSTALHRWCRMLTESRSFETRDTCSSVDALFPTNTTHPP